MTSVKLSEIRDLLDATVQVGDDKLNTSVSACCAGDLMSDILRGATQGTVLVTGLNNIQVIRTAVIVGVAAVILVREKLPDETLIAHARKHGLPLLSTPCTMFSACGRLYQKGLRGVEKLVYKSGLKKGTTENP
jgi:predicted transcriptional regulator